MSYSGLPLRLNGVRIRNVRCFENLNLNLRSPAGTRSWAVIFGDNGVGKTTLLRCIAMGLCDESSAAGLLREIYGDWHRTSKGKQLDSSIELRFETENGPAWIRTKIIPQRSGYSRVEQTTEFPKNGGEFPWDSIFACGYGAARRSFGTKDVSEYATIDAVYTLFNYDTPLQNPELVIRRIAASEFEGEWVGAKHTKSKKIRGITQLLDSIAAVLMLTPGSIKMGAGGLTLTGPWGDFQPIGGLGDGFQATLSWLADFLGWAILFDPKRPLEDVAGIVLIDELEQHLHPRWQRQIVKLLRDQFPNVQFIATTHTPMCAVGTTELSDQECELIKLERAKGKVVAIENLLPPRGQRADQVLTSLLFELPTAGDDITLGKIARLNQLATRETLSKEEKAELKQLRVTLRLQFSSEESEFETTILEEVREALARKRIQNLDFEAADFEVLRTLRDMAPHEKD